MTAQRERDEGWVLCGSDSWTCRSNRERKALQGERVGKPARDDAPYTPFQNFCHRLRARIPNTKLDASSFAQQILISLHQPYHNGCAF
jgi:hypothetical protein